MVQIDFLDGNVINNLVPVYTLQPNTLCIIYDDKRYRRKVLKGFEEAVRNKDSFIEIKEYACDSTNFEEINRLLEQIISEHSEEQIVADITGGPELMIAGACMIGKQGRLTPVYFDEDKNIVFSVFDSSICYKAKRITMDDYVMARGAKHYNNSRSLPSENEFESITRMSEKIFDYLEEWKFLQKHLSAYFYGYSGMHFSVNGIRCGKEMMRGIKELLGYFVEYGFISMRKDDRYVINNPKYKEYITNYGIWLEMYIYIKALECYDEAHLGYIIDWNSTDGMDTNDNEFDVVIMDDNHPVFISCKMTKPTSKDLTEIGYMAKRLGGRDGVAMLATTYPVVATSEPSTSLFYRMQKMDVGLLEASDFRKMSANQAFEKGKKFSKAYEE